MEYTIEFQKEPSLALVVVNGVLTVEGVGAYVTELLADRRWRAGTPILIDISAADTSGITSNDLRATTKLYVDRAESLGDARLAFVASEPVTYGMARVRATYADIAGVPRRCAVFDSCEKALAWLADESRPQRAEPLGRAAG